MKKEGGEAKRTRGHVKDHFLVQRELGAFLYICIWCAVLKDGFVKKIRSFFFYDNDVCVRTREYLPKERRKKKEGGKEFVGEADGKALTFLLSSFPSFHIDIIIIWIAARKYIVYLSNFLERF